MKRCSTSLVIVAAAAKSLQSCPTLCDPIDGLPPGSPVPGILQARTLEWVPISFSNAWKWKAKVKSLSHVRLFATPWTVAYQAPPSTGFSRQEYWSGLPLPSPSLVIREIQIKTTMRYHLILIRMATIKNSSIWRLNNTLLNNQHITEEIKICIETNENENTTTQNLWDTVKAVLGRRFIAIQAYLKKQEKSQINNLILHLKQLEKEEMKKC